jgi:nitroimidazol reductase NimA-like FMN-containing flavoprotein (pyridoxamine 5'-phosphate oxidase superfamily)
MRRADKEITSKKEMEGIIKSSNVCRIGFVDGKKPYVLAFNYGYAGGCIYIHCAADGRKLDIIKRNPAVCVLIDTSGELVEAQEPCEYGFKYRSVVAEGRAVVISGRPDKIKALKLLMKHITGKAFDKFRESSVGSIKIIRIKLVKMTGKKSGL